MFEISDSRRSIIFWSFVALVCWGFVLFLHFYSPKSYVWLGTEDALGENMTSVFYFGAGILLFADSIRGIRSGSSSLRKETLQLLIALFFIFVGGEEISWGQRLFGFETPSSVKEHNVQNEITFHNLTIFGIDSAILNQHTILNLIALLMGVVIPITNHYVGWIRDLLGKLHYPVQPISITMWFIVGLLHGQTIAKLDPHWTHTEIKELIFSIGFFLFGIGVFRSSRKASIRPATAD